MNLFKYKCNAPNCRKYDSVNACKYLLIGMFYCPYKKALEAKLSKEIFMGNRSQPF